MNTYRLEDGTVVRDDGVPMLTLVRARWGNDPDVPAAADLDEAQQYIAAALAAYSPPRAVPATPEGSVRVVIVTTATATIREEWTWDVPLAIAAEIKDEPYRALDMMAGNGDEWGDCTFIDCIDKVTGDEEDRDVSEVFRA